ncbi:hypothetical protein FSP39_015532 [Pinctada imbricata]|uniref:Uncharacterized protein n=1 Tax=Pinctada imbricata TaxID=66713 RepID=A0AA88YDC8_PINIB|nr:hypothetical protein FSP39_015532 [Pinctada imbricata]
MDVISAGPTGRSLRTLNNKNNLAGLYLKKRLDQYSREKSFIISHIDRDRFDTKDFLKQIQKIESDNNEAAVQYLGRTRKPKPHQRAPKATSIYTPQTSILPNPLPLPTPLTHDPNYISDDESQSPALVAKASSTTPVLKHTRTMPDIFGETSTPQRMRRSSTSPRIFVTEPIDDKDQITTPIPEGKTLSFTPRQDSVTASEFDLSHSKSSFPSIGRKSSLYLQIASAKEGPEYSDSSDEDDENETLDGRKRSRSRISTRRQSFLAWVNEKRKEGGLLPGYIKEKNTPESSKDNRRNSFMNWLSSRGVNLNRENSLQEISEDPEYGIGNINDVKAMTSRTANESPSKRSRLFGKNPFRQAGEIMRNLVFMKSYRRLPLDIRLKKFYEKVEKTTDKTRIRKILITLENHFVTINRTY